MQEKIVMLVVDDVEVNRASLRAMFGQEYEILEAEDGQRAIDILRARRVDIVILDVNMPVLDGAGVLGQMKADSALRNIPVIAKTSIDENMEVKMLEKGADDFIFSPCEPAIIKNRVKNIVQKYVFRQTMLQKKIEEEQHYNKVRDSFITRVSREIREDTQQIMALCEAGDRGECAEKEKILSDIYEQAEHLLTMVESVLDSSNMEHEQASTFGLQGIIKELNEEYASLCREKGIDFTMEKCEMLCENLVGDSRRLKRIWNRLLEKAYDNTQPGERIVSSYQQRRLGKHQVELEITIRGNIGPDDGYPITRSMVELLRGSMQVEDQDFNGVYSVVTIPFRIGKEPVTRKKRMDSIKVMVLDDNELTRDYHAAILARLGVACDTVANGEDATYRLRKAYAEGRGYDICFVNWYMLGGPDIIRQIRGMYAPDIMVIASSTNEKEHMEKEMRAAGVDHVLERPVYQATLYQFLKDICSGTAAQKEKREDV